VDLVDGSNRVIGRTTRREVRGRNLCHRGVGILCRDSRGRIYVHRRTDTKDIFPGMYDMFVGGVVGAGETYGVAARREIREELGIDGPEPEFLFTYLYQGDRNFAWIQVYRVTWDGPIRHQPEEVASGEWMDPAGLLDMIPRKPFVPDGLEIFDRYRLWQERGGVGEGLPVLP
jgi:8-oxo-dGTP pyrophosphatase MutT (NUDIX family)